MELILDCTESPFAEFTADHPEAQKPWAKEYARAQNTFLSPSQSVEIRTSGSTGAPKTIALSKGSMCHSALLTSRTFGLGPGTKALLCLPPTGIAGMMMLVRTMVCKWKLTCVAPSLDPLADVFGDFDFVAMTPVQAQRSMEKFSEKWRHIRKVIIGGAPVSARLEEKLNQSGPECFITYGMTETVSHVAVRRPGERFYFPLDGVRFETDERNCLTIKANHLEGHVQTNDVVSLQPDGSFELLGRSDNVINSGGLKIHPESLEHQCGHLFTQRFYITSAADDAFGQVPVVVVEGEMSTDEQESMVHKLKGMFGSAIAPRGILTMPKFEETESGKILRCKDLKRP